MEGVLINNWSETEEPFSYLGRYVFVHESGFKMAVSCGHRLREEGSIRSYPFESKLLLLFALLAAAVPSVAAPPQLPSPKQAEYRIAIHCSLNVLQLWRHDQLVKEYPIETGKGGVGKQRSGDHRTPVGDYEVSWMACRDGAKGHKIIDRRSWCKGNCFIDAATGPALEKLWTDSYGGDEAAVISVNYPNIKDSQKGFTGDCIHIHANKRIFDGMMGKSYGCIHMYPKDAQELYDMVDVGTPVKMLP